MPEARRYRQKARAAAVDQGRRRAVDAFWELARQRWFDEITLAEVAELAGTSVRTVIRQFGGKEGLVAGILEYLTPEVIADRTVSPGDIDQAITKLLHHYEDQGDITVRLLAVEPRYPVLSPLLDAGRKGHRAVTRTNFGPWLEGLPPAQQERAVDALVVATDVYTWKLLRRDMRRSADETRSMVRALVEAALAEFAPDETAGGTVGKRKKGVRNE